MPKRFTLSEAARLIGVAPITLKRWLLSRKVEEVSRDRNGWRVFTHNDVQRIKRFADSIWPPKSR
jgi:DNA-binding transcriptional MerR regulator